MSFSLMMVMVMMLKRMVNTVLVIMLFIETGELQEMIEKEGISLAELDYEDSNK